MNQFAVDRNRTVLDLYKEGLPYVEQVRYLGQLLAQEDVPLLENKKQQQVATLPSSRWKWLGDNIFSPEHSPEEWTFTSRSSSTLNINASDWTSESSKAPSSPRFLDFDVQIENTAVDSPPVDYVPFECVVVAGPTTVQLPGTLLETHLLRCDKENSG